MSIYIPGEKFLNNSENTKKPLIDSLEHSILQVNHYVEHANDIFSKYIYKDSGVFFHGQYFVSHGEEPDNIPEGYIQFVGEITSYGWNEYSEEIFPIEWLFLDEPDLEKSIQAFQEEKARKEEEARIKAAEEKAEATKKSELEQLAYLKSKYPDA